MQKTTFILILGILFLCISCAKDPISIPNSSGNESGVKLHFSLPERTEVTTRTTASPESVIDPNSVYVLVSSPTSESSVLLDYAVATIMQDGSYRVDLKEQPSQVSMDIIVNAKSILDLQSVSWVKGTTLMSEIKASLQTDHLPASNGVISANPSTHPMCGSSVVAKIDGNTSIGSAASPIILTPSTIKITIENRVAVNSGYTFKMIGANMGAAPEKGFIMPGEDFSTIATLNYGGNGDVSSMLTGVESVNNVQTTLPLFCYESVAANNTFVILKANYNNQNGYYKLGFFTDADKQNSRDLIRGFHYKIAVRAILTSGYRTAEEAISSSASNGIIYDVDVEDGESHDIITNGIQYLGVSNSEYIGYHTNYINEFEMYYTDGINNMPDNNFPLSPFTATILTYTSDPTWSQGVVTATEGITLVDESLQKVTTIPLQVATTAQPIRKELRIFMDNEFKEGQLDIRIGDLRKVIKIKRESSFPILGGVVSLGRDITFAHAKTLPDPMNPSALCDANAYSISYSENGAPLYTGDVKTEIDPAQELFLQIENRFDWKKSNYCYGELYLHHNTSQGRTKVSFSAEMLGGEPWGDYNIAAQYAVTQAFWKNSEKGERLVQLAQHQYVDIPTFTKFPYIGRWQVRIISGEDFITLDEWDNSLTTTNNRFDGDPEDRPVTGDKTVLHGKDPIIKFRIGLKSTNVGNKNRYGLIHLIYIDHRESDNSVISPRKVSCLIFVRQGEAPDNILTHGNTYKKYVPNAVTEDTFVAEDVKLSPYSLVDPTYGAGGNNITDHTMISEANKPTMAPYPSYMPYLLQWGGDRMIHPINPTGAIVDWPSWTGDQTTNYNPTIFKEYCPEGYITPPSNINIYNGLRCNLNGYPSNAVKGICVDGHIDRYIHMNDAANDKSFINYAPNTYTKLGWQDGTVLYNPETMSSIFFHANPLLRYPFTDEDGAGSIWEDRVVNYDYMWTSEANPDLTKGEAYATRYIGYNASNTSRPLMKKATAMPIRCIKAPSKP